MSVMKLVNYKCPGCGAQLTVDTDLKQARCQFCGSFFRIDDESRPVIINNAERAGYEFERGRQRAQHQQVAEGYAPQSQVIPGQGAPGQAPLGYMPPQTYYAQVQPVQQKPQRKTWLWALGWIVFFPVPLTIILLDNATVKQKLSPTTRYVFVAVLWIFVLISAIFYRPSAT